MLANFAQRNNDKMAKPENSPPERPILGLGATIDNTTSVSKIRQTFRQRGIDQTGRDFTFLPSGVGDNRSHAHLNNVARQRRPDMKEAGDRFACRLRDGEKKLRETARFWTTPMVCKTVQKLIQEKRLIVAEIVNAVTLLLRDGALTAVKKVREGQQMYTSGLRPDRHQAPTHECARCLNEFHAQTVNHTGAQNDRGHTQAAAGVD